MINKLKSFWRNRNKRERVMMLAVLFCALAIWASSMLSTQREHNLQIRDLQKNIAQAQAAIDMESVIQKRLEKLKSSVDRAKMLDAQTLQITVEAIAKQAELEFSISSVSTSQTGDFRINSITVSTTAQPLFKLAKLEELLSKLEPYVAVSQYVLNGNKNGDVIIRYTITSFN